MSNKTSVSIVLPVHNQRDHIESVVHEYVKSLSELPIDAEIILVTNACRDESPRLCNKLAEQYPSVHSIDTASGGWGHSVRLGLAAATGSVICYTNSARTTPEVLRNTVLYALNNPNTVIKVNRKLRENWRRRFGSLLFNLQCRAHFDLSTWDINGTPKVFPRHFARLLSLQRDDDLIDAEFLSICRKEGYPLLELPVHCRKRHGGKSTTNYKSALKMYWGAYQLWRNTR